MVTLAAATLNYENAQQKNYFNYTFLFLLAVGYTLFFSVAILPY